MTMTNTIRTESERTDSPNHLSKTSPILPPLEGENPELDSVLLAHIDVGVIMVDALGFITCANEKAALLLGVPTDCLRPGAAYADLRQWVMERSEQTGNNDSDFSYGSYAWPEEKILPDRFDWHVSNGTIVEQRSTPLPDGGSVHTLTDVGHDRRLRAKLHRMATTDPLTGVSNRRHFLHRCQHEIDRARRYNSDLALLVLDLDHFKSVNDRHGHAVGDAVLKSITAAGNASIRTVDLLGRMGGEEFGILLPETGIETAAFVAERLLHTIAARPTVVNAERSVFVTASIGLTVARPEDENPYPLLARADDALYRAKSNGRNRFDQYI